MRPLALLVVITACAAEPSERDPASLEPEGTFGKADGQCPMVPARIAPLASPQYACNPVTFASQAVVDDVNAFWGSSVVACTVGPDFPEGDYGAWSLYGTGYIYEGPRFIQEVFDAKGLTAVQYVIAHEFGHELQGRYTQLADTLQKKELTADCLAGYYLGSLACRGTATESSIEATLRLACQIADGTGDPAADTMTHGTCEQRMVAVAAGMRAYRESEAPLLACAL